MAILPKSKPLGALDRLKAAGSVLIKGTLPNPLATEPVDKSRSALVKELNDWCVQERAFWKPIFDFIREEQKFAAGKQWAGNYKDVPMDQRDYVGDMVQQMVNRKTAGLCAKNPTPEAELKEQLNFEVWDGKEETIAACKQLAATIAPQALAAHAAEIQGAPVDPPPAQMQADIAQAEKILADYARGMQEKARLERVAQTGERLIKQQWDAQSPDFLISAKQAVTRIITSRVAYVKVMYRRDMQTVPVESANDTDFSDKLASLEAQVKAITDENLSPDDPKIEEARLLKQSLEQQIEQMQAAQQVPSDEGVVIDWLSATSVIVDRRCKCLKEFIGAHRIAHEIQMTVEECEKKFGVSLRDSGAKIYKETGEGWTTDDRTDYQNEERQAANARGKQKVCVWHIEDKDTGLCYVVCDGVKDFLKEPYTNEPEVNRFWSIVAITFNAQEVETNDPDNDVTIFPRSDVRLMMPMQINVNKAGQEKRLHRAANRPGWVGVKSKFASTAGQNDLSKLASPRSGHDVLMLENLNGGEKISDFIQPLPKQPFDQNLYDNAQDSQAMMLATGQQPSDIGAQRPDEKATGQNIAAQARAASEASNIDDLNFAFSTMAQMCWEMLMAPQGMSQATVQALVGRGAVWPDINREMIAQSILFKIEAGSMGRPNQAAELQKIQVLAPQILEMFKLLGRSPEPLLKLVLKQWDANIDLDALLADAQIQAPPTQQAPPQHPPSLALSMNFKDAPPEVQEQIEKLFGFTPAPPASHLIEKAGHGAAMDAHHQNAGGGVPLVRPPAGRVQPPAAAPAPPMVR